MSTTTPELPFGAQLIGRTEKSLGALLDGVLASSGLSEPEYVALRVSADREGEPRAEVVRQLASAFRKGDRHADDLVTALQRKGLLEGDAQLRLTNRGHELHHRLVAGTEAITTRLWGDLPPADLSVAARVLGTVLRRAAAERV